MYPALALPPSSDKTPGNLSPLTFDITQCGNTAERTAKDQTWKASNTQQLSQLLLEKNGPQRMALGGQGPPLATQELQGQPKTYETMCQEENERGGCGGRTPFLITLGPLLFLNHMAAVSPPHPHPFVPPIPFSMLFLVGQPPNTDTQQLIESQKRVG